MNSTNIFILYLAGAELECKIDVACENEDDDLLRAIKKSVEEALDILYDAEVEEELKEEYEAVLKGYEMMNESLISIFVENNIPDKK